MTAEQAKAPAQTAIGVDRAGADRFGKPALP
jgi:hypothetical protein